MLKKLVFNIRPEVATCEWKILCPDCRQESIMTEELVRQMFGSTLVNIMIRKKERQRRQLEPAQ
jgi:hypothetical protein